MGTYLTTVHPDYLNLRLFVPLLELLCTFICSRLQWWSCSVVYLTVTAHILQPYKWSRCIKFGFVAWKLLTDPADKACKIKSIISFGTIHP